MTCSKFEAGEKIIFDMGDYGVFGEVVRVNSSIHGNQYIIKPEGNLVILESDIYTPEEWSEGCGERNK